MVNQSEMNRKLYSTMWKNQCKTINTDLLDFEDAILVQKCIHQKEITDYELEELKQVIRSYTNIDKEYNLTDAEDNIDEFKNIITSEQQFLDLVDSQENLKLEKEYLVNGKKHTLKFIVNPRIDSRSVYDVIDHANLFNYISEDDKKILNKASENKQLTDREKRIVTRLNHKLERKLTTGDNYEYLLNCFLARQVEWENTSLNSYEERKEFWSKVDFGIREDLFNTVKSMLNSGDDTLFRYN